MAKSGKAVANEVKVGILIADRQGMLQGEWRLRARGRQGRRRYSFGGHRPSPATSNLDWRELGRTVRSLGGLCGDSP